MYYFTVIDCENAKFGCSRISCVLICSINERLEFKLPKDQEISKAVFLETPLPKKLTKYYTKFCPMKSNGVSRKNGFEIY